VIPEAWKFIPQKYNNPCKRGVESFIRQGATNENFIWIDSQDMAGVDKAPLKQISTWILGYQSERNEVKHTLDQMSLPKKLKPKEDDIMTLNKGHFFLSSFDGVKKVYVQPSWLDDKTSVAIALGKIHIEAISKPDRLVPFAIATSQKTGSQPADINVRFPGDPAPFDDSKLRSELIELRNDVFNKFQEFQTYMNKLT
jgi:hypothetical protein